MRRYGARRAPICEPEHRARSVRNILLTFCRNCSFIADAHAEEEVCKGVLERGERGQEGKWAEVVEPRVPDMETTGVYRHFARGADADTSFCAHDSMTRGDEQQTGAELATAAVSRLSNSI